MALRGVIFESYAELITPWICGGFATLTAAATVAILATDISDPRFFVYFFLTVVFSLAAFFLGFVRSSRFRTDAIALEKAVESLFRPRSGEIAGPVRRRPDRVRR
jgi:hypothetical protein